MLTWKDVLLVLSGAVLLILSWAGVMWLLLTLVSL